MATKYQTTQTGDCSSMANFQAWAGPTTGIAFALSTLGFAKQSDTYTAQWSNASTIGAAALVATNGGMTVSGTFGTITNYSGTPLASGNFLGAWAQATSYTAGQVVTYSVNSLPMVFICTTAVGQESITSCNNSSGGNTVYNGTFTTARYATNTQVVITGFVTNPSQNNGTFVVVSVTGTTLTVVNASGIAETATAKVQDTPMGYNGSVYTANTNNWSPYYMEIWSSQPSYTVTAAGNASGGNTAYTGTFVVTAFPVGASTTIAGFTNAGNNGSFTIVSCTSTTLTVANAGGVSETHAATATTPLPQAFMKIEYGTYSTTTTQPALTFELGSAYVSNSGVLSGNTTNREIVGNAATNGATPQEMDFYGDGQVAFGCILWRNATLNMCFGWERSIQGQVSNAPVYATSPAYLTYVHWVNAGTSACFQQSVFLAGGPGATIVSPRLSYAATVSINQATTLICGGVSPAMPVFPLVGWVGNPMTLFIGLENADTSEGVSIVPTVYGASHTYLTTKSANGAALFGSGTANWGMGLRFE